MKIKSKKINALILAGFITIGLFGITPATVDGQSTSNSITRAVTKIQTGTTTANTNMRSSSSTKGKVLSTLKKGTKVEIVKKESNGWYKVKYKTKTGYVSGKYLKVTTTSSSSTVTKTQTGTTISNTNMRSSSSTKGKVLATLKKGTKVEIVKKESNGWYKVKYKTKTGYINDKYLKITTTNSNSSTSTKTMRTTASLNVRSGAGTKYKVLGTLKKGDSVEVVSSSNGWSKIKYKSDYGYVSNKYLTSISNNNNNNSNNNNNNNNININNKDLVGYEYVYEQLGNKGWLLNSTYMHCEQHMVTVHQDNEKLLSIAFLREVDSDPVINSKLKLLRDKRLLEALNLVFGSQDKNVMNDALNNKKNFVKKYNNITVSVIYIGNDINILFQ